MYWLDCGNFRVLRRLFLGPASSIFRILCDAAARPGSLDSRAALVRLDLFLTLGVYMYAVFLDAS